MKNHIAIRFFLFFILLAIFSSSSAKANSCVNPNFCWVEKSPMPTARREIGLTTSSQGNIYVVGGYDGNGKFLDTLEMYNPTTDAWTTKSPMPTARNELGFTRALNNKLYSVGGFNGSSTASVVFFNELDEYDPTTDTWTTKSPMNYARSTIALSVNSKGNIYALGGHVNNDVSLNQSSSVVEEYNPITNSWMVKTPLPIQVMEAGAALGNDGYVHVIGGWTPDNQAVDTNYSEQTPNNIELSVPSLFQTSDPWERQIYDGANFWSPSAKTIKNWGCALTSYVMVLRYFGINKLPDGSILDPGTLNIWLKNNNGYMDGKSSGFINPIAISILSKKAKQINNITSFHALEYSRVIGNDLLSLSNSIKNKIPAILDLGGHFVVAKGINENTFSINDPYYQNRNNLTDYNNTFNYFNKLSPSSTDLSYVMIMGDQNLEFSLENSHGDIVGEEYLQESLINEETNQHSGKPIKIILFPKPENDSYSLSILTKEKKSDFQIFLYDKDGGLRLSKYSINTNKRNKSYDLIINFNKNNFKKNKIKHKYTNIIKEFENQLKYSFNGFFD